MRGTGDHQILRQQQHRQHHHGNDSTGKDKLVTASFDSFKIKAKVKRELDIPSEKVILKLPAEHCCIYEDNKLI